MQILFKKVHYIHKRTIQKTKKQNALKVFGLLILFTKQAAYKLHVELSIR